MSCHVITSPLSCPPSTTTAGPHTTTDATTPDKKPVDTRDGDDREPRSSGVGTEADQLLTKADKASLMVMLGAIAVGSLVGIIICALTFVVVVLGAIVAAFCCQDSKVLGENTMICVPDASSASLPTPQPDYSDEAAERPERKR